MYVDICMYLEGGIKESAATLGMPNLVIRNQELN